LIRQDGPEWKQQREVLNPAFTHTHLKKLVDVFCRSALKVCDNFSKQIDASSNKSVGFDAMHWMTQLTLDVIGLAGFGYDFQALDERMNRYHKSYEKVVEFIVHPLRFLIPYFESMPLPVVNEVNASAEQVEELFRMMIAQKRKALAAQTDSHSIDKNLNDILDVMLQTQHGIEDDEDDELTKTEKTVATSKIAQNKTRKVFTEEELVNNLFLFFVAGHETSASALTWTLHELSLNQAVQQKAYEEVRSVFGADIKADRSRMPTYDEVCKLDYIQMVLRETLRKWTPAAGVFRIASKDVKIGEYLVPKGTIVFASFFAIHLDPKIYPDPEKFDPERFTAEENVKRHAYAWLPFSVGPRSCIGSKFSMLEMKAVLAMLLHRFVIKPDPSFKLELGRGITTRPKNGLRVLLEPRV
jgi:cytochrome P450